MTDPNIIKIIKQRMAERGVTQTDVAQAIGIDQPAISNYLRGWKHPGMIILQRIFAYLQLDVVPLKKSARSKLQRRRDLRDAKLKDAIKVEIKGGLD